MRVGAEVGYCFPKNQELRSDDDITQPPEVAQFSLTRGRCSSPVLSLTAVQPPSLSPPGATASCVSSEHFSHRRNRLARLGFSQLLFLLPTLPENSRCAPPNQKKKKNFPYEVKQITPRTCALKSEPLAKLILHNQMGGGKWLL